MTADTSNSLWELPPLPKGIRWLTPAQAAKIDSLSKDAHFSVERCRTCGGTKAFQWYKPGSRSREDIVTYRCPCADQMRAWRWFYHCGVKPTLMRLDWADFYDPTLSGAARQIADYLSYLDAYVSRGVGLTLSGPSGNGKTMLSALLAKDLIGKHAIDCYTTSFDDLISAFADAWRDKEHARWFESRVRNAGVLFIDDVGREGRGARGVDSLGNHALETIIRHRVQSSMPTFVTTNLSEAKVAEGYGGHTMSLLSESNVFVTMSGGDIRRDILQRKLDEPKWGIRVRPVMT